MVPASRSQPLAMFFIACCWRWRECVISDRLRAHGVMPSQPGAESEAKPGVESGTFPFKRPAFADRRWQAVALVSDLARAIESIQ